MGMAGGMGMKSLSGMSGLGKPSGMDNQFSPGKSPFGGNDSFGVNRSFGGGNSTFAPSTPSFNKDSPFGGGPNQKRGGIGGPGGDGGGGGIMPNRMNTSNDQFSDSNECWDSDPEKFDDGNQSVGDNDQFGGGNQNRGNDQFSIGNQNRGGGNMFGVSGQSRGGINPPFGGNNQNRPVGNQGRPNLGGGGMNQSQNVLRVRGNRGGKNRNKNKEVGVNSFRDRSPINRGPRDDKLGHDWEKTGDRSRHGSFGSGSFDGGRFDDLKGPVGGPMAGSHGVGPREMSSGYGGSSGSVDYQSAVAEKNDCEIIVVNKGLTDYAEAIEMRLKKMGLTVDLLFPNEDVPLSRVLGNIASRGCLYAVVVTHINQEHHSLTLNILHGLPQEHRNMPLEDAINLITRDFANYKSGGRSVPLNTPFANERHPDAIQVLLNMLADNHQLTVLQYDRVIKYLEVKREEQVQVELGDAKDLPSTTLAVSDPKQAELQSRILNILNSNKTAASVPAPSPVPAPAPVPPANWGAATSTTSSTTTSTTTGVSPSPLLNNPTVQRALDSLLQGNLLKNIGDQPPAATPAPLFAAFPNIGRF
ncbi:PE-PGRS family protein PE_PGRS30 isoform X1 [Orussus abietinus]|uniref:PE-PGRS family protein PE_PGRS30 isoform X1 n=1 Tax=Orussus abietinus TaxID=222816 RepID=UPI000C716232|nr:PE-PGRS family protein PE_PGRS30 isoform X1 [Orussus abietinus]